MVNRCDDQSFAPMINWIDAKIYRKAEEYHADYISVADTVKIMNPRTTYYMISELKKVVKIPICMHYHDDLEAYDLTKMKDLSKLVETYSEVLVARNKAVVGSKAFVHKSGIHVAAVLEEPRTYELYSPEMMGAARHIIIGTPEPRHLNT
jgi:methanogen homocitrate synthase